MADNERAIITARFATPADVAAVHKIPPERVKELSRLVEEIVLERERSAAAAKRKAARNASPARTAGRSQKAQAGRSKKK